MSTCTSVVRWIWLVFDIILFILGIAVLGFTIYNLVTIDSTDGFWKGEFIYSYTALTFSALMFIGGILGFVAIGTKNAKVIGICTSLLGSLVVGLAMCCLMMHLLDKVQDMMQSWWNETNDLAHDLTQYGLECCGFLSSAEYTTIPESCKNPSGGATFTANCKTKINAWLDDNKVIWACSLAGWGLIAIVNLVLSIVFLFLLNRDKNKVEPEEIAKKQTQNKPSGEQRGNNNKGRQFDNHSQKEHGIVPLRRSKQPANRVSPSQT